MNRVSIIILNWNGWQDTIECLESLYQIDYSNYDVVLVDNGSEDESIEKIKEYCEGKIEVSSKFFKYDPSNKPIKVIEYTREEAENGGGREKEIDDLPSNRKLILIKNEKNYGFAEGNNIGIRYAMKSLKPEYILFLNNDTVVEKNFLKELVGEAFKKGLKFVQPKILKYDNSGIDNLGFLCSIIGNTKPNLNFNKFFYLSGACVLIHKDGISNLLVEEGFFDKKLFAYFEDVDVSWRAWLLGYKLSVLDNVVCYHKGSKSFSKSTINTYYIDFRNKLRIMLKNYHLYNLLWIIPLALFLKFVIVFKKSIFSHDIGYLYSYIKAIWWNVQNVEDTVKVRRKIQFKRKVGDRLIIKQMSLF